jgi:hypothetical protein
MPAANISLETKNILSTKIIVPVVGISSIGKNTLMDKAVQLYPEFYRSSGFTTREPRYDGEAAYRAYLPDDEASKQALINGEGTEALVQYEVHPKTGKMYGTTLQDYAGKINLLDTVSNGVDVFRDLGFAACRPVVLVATPHEWLPRFDSNNFSQEERNARIAEGIISIEWSLGQRDKVQWLHNADGQLQATAETLKSIATGGTNPNELEAQKIGTQLLAYLYSISEI